MVELINDIPKTQLQHVSNWVYFKKAKVSQGI